MIGFSFFVILNFGFVRVEEQRFEVVILFGVVLGWVDYKLFDAIIFTQLEIGLTVFFTEAVVMFKLSDMVLCEWRFFSSRRFDVRKTVTMGLLRGKIVVVDVIGMKSKFFIFGERSGLLVEREVILFDGVWNLIVEGGRFVFGEPFFLGNFAMGVHSGGRFIRCWSNF